jgi:hypothetical protein
MYPCSISLYQIYKKSCNRYIKAINEHIQLNELTKHGSSTSHIHKSLKSAFGWLSQFCFRYSDGIMALVKLRIYGVTEDQILLYVNRIFEEKSHKINSLEATASLQ